jgi:prolipoprotein diacylglyceryltransferase
MINVWYHARKHITIETIDGEVQTRVDRLGLSLYGLLASVPIPFMYYFYMENHTITMYIIIAMIDLVACVAMYALKLGNTCFPEIWGYHEWYHLILMVGQVLLCYIHYLLLITIKS